MRFYYVKIDKPLYHFNAGDIVFEDGHFLALCPSPKRHTEALWIQRKRTFRTERKLAWSHYFDCVLPLERQNEKKADYAEFMIEVTKESLTEPNELFPVKKAFEAALPHFPDQRGQSYTPKEVAKDLHKTAFNY